MSDQNDLNQADYAHAQLTIAWAKRADEPSRQFIFAQVELFTEDQPPLKTEPERTEALPGQPSFRIFARRLSLSAPEAIRWYDRFVTSGTWTRPDASGQCATDPDHEARSPRGAIEPPWPRVKLLVGDDLLGLVPNGLEQPLVSISFPALSASLGMTDPQRGATIEFLIREVGIDLASDEVLWQSAQLVAANPRIRRFGVRLETDSSDTHDSGFLVRTVLRSGRSFDGLRIQLLERRDTGWWLLFDGPLNNSQLRIPVAAITVDELQWAVHEQGGRLLQYAGPATFLRSIRLAMRVVGSRRVVRVPALKGRKEDTFTVDAADQPQLSAIGDGRIEDGSTILKAARRRIDMKRAAATFDQIWFDGDADDAAPRIRELLSRAQSRVMFVDPYIGSVELVRFATAVPFQSTTVCVLGSMEGVRAAKRSTPGSTVTSVLTTLSAQADAVKRTMRLRNLEVRLMKSRRADIHDRFIVCDNEAWSLGSSLNEFGSRGTMLLKIPHPELVIPRLTISWEQAAQLPELIEQYTNSGDAPDDGDSETSEI